MASVSSILTGLYNTVNVMSNAVINFAGEAMNVAEKGWAANLGQTKGYSKEEALGLSQMINIASEPTKALGKIYDQILNQFQAEAELKSRINEETGLTGKLSEDLRRSIINSYPALIQLGYGAEQLSKYYTTLVEKTGKWNLQNQESLKRTAEVSRAFVGDLDKMAEIQANMQAIGLGTLDVADEIEKIGISSMSLGLRAKTTITDIDKNISMLNTYGFKNGVQGLGRMAQLSTEFRMNMEQTFKIAEKVFSPEGAIELSANLQVIGGVLGDFNDPLKLMYMATNNVEGLQTALIDAASSLATYNEEQGRFEITGINLRRAQAMAKELGVDYNELAKGAISAAERMEATTVLMSRGLQMDDEDREFLTNLSEMEGGQMVIKIPESLAESLGRPTTIALSEMTNDIKSELVNNRDEIKKQDSMSIAMNQLTLTEQIDRNVMAIASAVKVRMVQTLKNDFENQSISTQLQMLSTNLGVTVDELGDVANLNIVPDMDKWVSKIRGLLISNDTEKEREAAADVRKKLNLVKEAQTAERKAQNMEIRHTHEIKPTSTLWDTFGRHVASRPETWDVMYDSNVPKSDSFMYTGGY
jgi:hypothetical protein